MKKIFIAIFILQTAIAFAQHPKPSATCNNFFETLLSKCGWHYSSGPDSLFYGLTATVQFTDGQGRSYGTYFSPGNHITVKPVPLWFCNAAYSPLRFDPEKGEGLDVSKVFAISSSSPTQATSPDKRDMLFTLLSSTKDSTEKLDVNELIIDIAKRTITIGYGLHTAIVYSFENTTCDVNTLTFSGVHYPDNAKISMQFNTWTILAHKPIHVININRKMQPRKNLPTVLPKKVTNQ